MKSVCQNKRATFEYELLDKFEAGIVLTGDEIKSVRDGNMSINEAFCLVRGNQVFLKNAYIKPYDNAYAGYQKTSDARRDRVLLLNKREIGQLRSKVEEKSLTIVPLSAYFAKSYLKVEIALARGKKLYNKKDTIKERDIKRQSQRDLVNMGMK